ncbi:sigma-70 family RNA polymerase sigma factor [bacterium 3DAC]|nr:sigma-70 family RNA polymerase sigma factor [bacterium 3DAC]
MGRVNEKDLIKRAKKGDVEAFEKLFARFERDIYTLAYRFVGNKEDAEDVLQNVALKMWEHLKGFKGKSSLWTWLYRITVNESMRMLRHRKSTYSLPRYLSTPSPDIHLEIEDLLMRLPDRERAVILLRDVYNYTFEEIADMIGTSPGNVRVILHRARKHLKAMWVRGKKA